MGAAGCVGQLLLPAWVLPAPSVWAQKVTCELLQGAEGMDLRSFLFLNVTSAVTKGEGLVFLYTSLAAGDQWLTLHRLSQLAACKARAVGLEPLAGCCSWAGSARAPAMPGQAVLSNLGWAHMPWFRVPVSFPAVCSQLPGSEHGCSCGEI